MRHKSAYLDWYTSLRKLKYDFRSSGIAYFKYNLNLDDVDLSANYAYGNPEAVKLLSQRYRVQPENVFVSSEGASGQNARIIRLLAERSGEKCEAIVEYPTYEPLLRLVQEYFPHVKRLVRDEQNAFKVDAAFLQKIASRKTALLVLTNPHAPSSAVLDNGELKGVMKVAREYGFYVLCDEIYAEFDREAIPTIFCVDEEFGITTTSLTKAYGLGGLKLGIALANEKIVKELYVDTVNTVGNAANMVQMIAVKLLKEGREALETHKKRWNPIKSEAEKWLMEKGFDYFPNNVGVTYWVKLPIKDTYNWTNKHTIPKYSLATVPGTFFLFRNGYELVKSDWIRLGLGNIYPEEHEIKEALKILEKAINIYK